LRGEFKALESLLARVAGGSRPLAAFFFLDFDSEEVFGDLWVMGWREAGDMLLEREGWLGLDQKFPTGLVGGL